MQGENSMNVLTITATIDQLRGRFHRCRYLRAQRDYEAIALQIGIAKSTLNRFAKGGAAQEEILTKIEQWCELEETAHAQ